MGAPEVGEAKKVEKCQRRARAKLKMRQEGSEGGREGVKNGPTREISPPDLTATLTD